MSQNAPPFITRFIMALSGFIFACIGAGSIFWIWQQDGQGTSPWIFKLVASMISATFMMMGGSMVYRMIKGSTLAGSSRLHAKTSQTSHHTGYNCSSCGHTLQEGDAVSPLGDVKCSHCGNWFNIHNP